MTRTSTEGETKASPDTLATLESGTAAPPSRTDVFQQSIVTSARRAVVMVAEATVVGAIGAVIAAVVIEWKPSLWRVFFNYSGDTFFNAINGALANPLGLTNSSSRLGWPYGLNMADFPAAEPLFTWFQWLAHRFVRDDLTVLAAMWFLGFALVASTTYLVLRGLKFDRWPSVVVALVYDFVPYHMMRAIGHTNLALYIAVPIAGMLLLWVMSGRLDRPKRASTDWQAIWKTPDWWIVAICVIVIAASARYYAVFFLMLLVVVGCGRAAAAAQFRLILPPVIIACLTLSLALLTGIPQLIQVAVNGGNLEVAQRSRFEADLYSFRLTDLIAPIADHRLDALANLSTSLRRTAFRGEEGISLGWFMLAGLAFIIGVTVLRHPRRLAPGHALTDPLGLSTNTAILAALCFLIGTVGGVGGAIAALGYTQIRGLNRISIYIAFCGAVGLALALSWLWTLRKSRQLWQRWTPIVVLPLVLVLAVLDQTGTTRPDQAQVAVERASDQAFFGAMADSLGADSAVFQLPYVPFPESGSAVLDYAGFRGFFNDGGRLNWSYGGMRGRESDWQRSWVTTDPETQVVGLSAAGFDAVLVDRAGYTPETAIEPRLQGLLGPAHGTSEDQRFVWFDLRPLRDRLQASKGADWMKETGARVTRPIGIQFRADTYRSSGPGAQEWGSIGGSTIIEFRRYDDIIDPVDIELAVAIPAGSQLTVSGGDWEQTEQSDGQPLEFRHTASLQSETVSIMVSTNAPNIAGITDARPDVRGSVTGLTVFDSTLAQQIKEGDLRIPSD